MATDDSLGTRMLAALRQMVTPTGEGEDPQGASLVSEAAERFRLAATLTGFVGTAGRDQIVRAGESYELSAALPRLKGPLAQSIRFALDEVRVGEVPSPDGLSAHLNLRTETPGVYTASWDAVGPLGVTIVARDPRRFTVVQVVDDAPVVAVDADLLLTQDPPTIAALGALCDPRISGTPVHVVYIDLAERRRTDAVRAAIEAAGLPRGAVLSYPESEADFGTFGVSFRRVFVTHATRHARASGVPLVALVSQSEARWDGCSEEGIEWVSPDAVQTGLADGSLAARLRDRAAALQVAWETEDRLSLRLDRTTQTKAIPGNACHVELDNRAAREAVLAAIAGARATVHVQLYILEDSRFTDRLGVGLIAAARRGVAVRLLVDGLFSGHDILGLSNPVVDGLRREPGIEVQASGPIHRPSALEAKALKERDHRKLIIIDGEWAVVGGRNAGDCYYFGFDEVPIADFTAHERIPWLDAHVEVRGPLVAEVQDSFVEAWVRAGGEAPEELAQGAPAVGIPEPGPGRLSRARFVVHDGIEDADGMAAYEALLDGAEHHVYIVNDFPIASPIVTAVRRALGRGVTVTLLTGCAVARRGDGTFFRGPVYRQVFEYVTKRRLEPLIRAGLIAYEYATEPELPLIVCQGGVVRPYVHAKLMTTDGRAASVGSANLDATASYWEREANIVVEDPAVVLALEARLEGLLAHSHRLDLDSEYWKRERLVREVATRLWPDSMYS